MFISRKLQGYKAKHARWIADARLSPNSKYWEVIRVSPASGEFALLFAYPSILH